MSYESGELRKYSELAGKTFVICIGASKCATSWIYYYLGALPEVTVSPLKELHFFNARFPSLSFGDMDAFAMKRVGFHLEREGDPVENLAHNRSLAFVIQFQVGRQPGGADLWDPWSSKLRNRSR